MTLWPEVKRQNRLKDIFNCKRDAKLWEKIFNSVYDNKINTWDFQWTFSCLINNALSVMPNVNLVSNIGFNAESTHTTQLNRFSNMKTEPMLFPLIEPPFMLVDSEADDYTTKNNFRGNINIIPTIQRQIRKFIRN